MPEDHALGLLLPTSFGRAKELQLQKESCVFLLCEVCEKGYDFVCLMVI